MGVQILAVLDSNAVALMDSAETRALMGRAGRKATSDTCTPT